MLDQLRRVFGKPKGEELDPYILKRISERVVLHYFQSWGQSKEEKIEAIKDAATLARVEVIFEIQDGNIVPMYPPLSPWQAFRQELDKCFPLGHFESEAKAVQDVIQKYHDRKE